MNKTELLEARHFVSSYINKKKFPLEVDEIVNESYIKIYENGSSYNHDLFVKEALDIIHNHIRERPNVISFDGLFTKKTNDSFDQQCSLCGTIKHMDDFSSSIRPTGRRKYKKICKACVNLKERAARGVWKPIQLQDLEEIAHFDNGYSITNFARAVGVDGKLLTPQKMKNGYLRVAWGNKNRKYLHRLVAIAFIPNPNNLPEVNHKDGKKENCHFLNLEWSTHKDNIIHAYKVLKVHLSEKNIAKFQRRRKRHSLVAV